MANEPRNAPFEVLLPSILGGIIGLDENLAPYTKKAHIPTKPMISEEMISTDLQG